MTMNQDLKYPIGEQDFKSLREMDCVYIDKTRFIATILSNRNKYFFLARPRRFGKSLFLSTLQYFFEGDRPLFKNLYIDTFDWSWQSHPVLRLDLNTDRYADKDTLVGVLDSLFRTWEDKYEVDVKDQDFSQRFRTIIRTAHEKTGQLVVFIVD